MSALIRILESLSKYGLDLGNVALPTWVDNSNFLHAELGPHKVQAGPLGNFGLVTFAEFKQRSFKGKVCNDCQTYFYVARDSLHLQAAGALWTGFLTQDTLKCTLDLLESPLFECVSMERIPDLARCFGEMPEVFRSQAGSELLEALEEKVLRIQKELRRCYPATSLEEGKVAAAEKCERFTIFYHPSSLYRVLLNGMSPQLQAQILAWGSFDEWQQFPTRVLSALETSGVALIPFSYYAPFEMEEMLEGAALEIFKVLGREGNLKTAELYYAAKNL